MDPKGIDEDLRARIRSVAEQRRVTDRTALRYAPDHPADEIAMSYVVMTRARPLRRR